jgi:Ca2+-binding EF-hand superfamily protein
VPGCHRLSHLRVAIVVPWLLLCGAATAMPMAGSPAEYLNRMDLDGDGRVSLREYQDYLSRGFVQLDRDGDGVLNASELPPGTRSRRAPTLESHLRSLAAVFDRQDANNDAHLDARELAAPPR